MESVNPENRSSSERRLRSIAEQLGLPFVDLSELQIDADLFNQLSAETALNLNVVPISFADNILTIALSDPLDLRLEQRLISITGHRISVAVATSEQIKTALRQSETSHRVLNKVSSDFKPQIVREDGTGQEQVVDVETIQGQSGVVQLTNSILMAALQKQASDIHVEAYADRIDVRYRIEGVLYPATDALDVQFHSELLSRIKVMADLDIAEKRLPQDGRFRLRIDGRDVDFRVSVLPTQFGENAVIRVLDKTAVARFGSSLTLDDLGLNVADIASLRRAVRQPHGLVLITGPTGSGKTTTLYGALSEMTDGQEKIITIEDPIEYQLEGISQIAVNEKKGLTFASGLRSILRHDPDKIMVGEIRDLATAEIAVQAALTGHLVLASVHANSAFDVISRFTHWGIDLFDFVTALKSVSAQRLLRKVCPHCAKPVEIGDEVLQQSGLDPAQETATQWVDGTGCRRCNDTGYQGRTAVVEHLVVTPDIAELMHRRASISDLSNAGRNAGMANLRSAALDLARNGRTSLAEVNRITSAE